MERHEAAYRRSQTRFSRAVRTHNLFLPAHPSLHSTRIKAENEKFAAEPPLPRKKSRISKYAPYRATHAKDMTPVTLEGAKLKGGWVVTPLGRVYRPLRMKPLRPLPPLPSSVSAAAAAVKGKGKGKDGTVKVRKRVKKPDVRARRRKIDMVKYGSVYLKGRFLDVDVPEGVGGQGVEEVRMQLDEGGSSEEEDEEVEREEDERMDEEDEDVEGGGEESEAEEDEVMPVHRSTTTKTPVIVPPQPISQPQPQIPATSQSSSSGVNLDLEKQQSLNLLASLFGASASNDEDDWIGKESPGSDVDEADLARSRVQAQSGQTEEVEFEVVPRERGLTKSLTRTDVDEKVEGMDADMDVDEEVETEEQGAEEPEVSKVPSKEAQKQASTKATTQLKDLFAPSEAEGSYHS